MNTEWSVDSIARTDMSFQQFADTVDKDPDDIVTHNDDRSRVVTFSGIFHRNYEALAKLDWAD